MSSFFLIILFGYVIYLHTKISDLSRKIGQQFIPPQQPTVPGTIQNSATVPTVGQQSTNTGTQISDPAAGSLSFQTSSGKQESALWNWISTDWPMKLGALLVVLGLGWFVSYAFAQNWIGPLGRISLGLLFGTSMLVAGFLRARKNAQQGTIIMALGAAAILITTYAAREVYDFFTPFSALLLMATAAAFIAYSSVADRVLSRALVGILVACIAPFLTVSADPSVAATFLYLFVLISASIWVVTITGWKELLVAAAAIYGFFSILSLSGGIPAGDKPTMIVLVTAFVIMFYGVGVISAIKSKKVVLADIFIKLLSAGFFMLWVHELVPQHWQSLILVLASSLTAVAAWVIQSRTANKWLVVLHGALALVYLAVAISFELEGSVALIAYIALTTVGAWLAGSISQNYKIGQLFGAPFLLLTVAAISNASFLPKWEEIFIVGILGAVLLLLGYFWYEKLQESGDATAPVSEVVTIYLYGALFLTVAFIWLSFEKLLISKDTAHAFSLITYALAGVGMYGYGQINSLKKTKIAGSVLLGLVIARLLLVEVWNMRLVARVIVFTLIGFLLMGVAFLRPKTQKES